MKSPGTQKNEPKKSSKRRVTSGKGGAKKTDKSVTILGLVINSTQKSQVLRLIGLQRKKMLHVATVNPEFVMEARVNKRFAEVLSNCTTVADGWGVVWAYQILKSQMTNSQVGKIERVSGVWLTEQILKRADEKGEKVFLLGAKEGVAERAAQKMNKKYPNARLSWYEGARSVTLEKSEEASMTIAKINSVSPDYLLVAYGSPWQDMWIEENRPYLRTRVAMGIGGVLDEWAGEAVSCPEWIDNLGFKWLFRLVVEPKRWKRIMRVFQFGLLVLWEKLKMLF